MNKTIEKYIPDAMTELENYETKQKMGKKTIEKEMKGYIASMGASITMSGLIPTLAFYSSKENSAKGDRSELLKWISNILAKQKPYQAEKNVTNLFEYALKATTNKRKLEQDILDVSVALKLCIRTFELSK